MTHKGNNVIPNGHFHKKWQRRIKTWFNQPAKKFRRRTNRKKKALKIAPRPTSALRPAVRCPTVRYHKKLRLGRGFTLEEIKRVGLSPRFARTIGIAVDHRRRNKSVESIQVNNQRLKEYLAKLILFPLKNNKKIKKGEANQEEQTLAAQLNSKIILPIRNTDGKFKARAITEEDQKFSPFAAQRKARIDLLLMGKRQKRLLAAADNVEDVVKKESKKQKKLKE